MDDEKIAQFRLECLRFAAGGFSGSIPEKPDAVVEVAKKFSEFVLGK